MIEELRREFEDKGIRKVKVGGFDVDGVLRGKYISLDKFWSSVEKGFGFCDVIFGWDISDQLYDNAKVTGWDTGYPDALARIDISTFRVLPDAPDTANFIVDFYTQDGAPHPACPRNLLKHVRQRAADAGFSTVFSAEFEFWIFQETPHSLEEKGFRGLDPLSPGMFGYSWLRQSQYQVLVDDILDTCAAYDIEIEGIHTETGPGVWEAAIRCDDVLAAADKAALFKTTVKQICARHDLTVTFMASVLGSLIVALQLRSWVVRLVPSVLLITGEGVFGALFPPASQVPMHMALSIVSLSAMFALPRLELKSTSTSHLVSIVPLALTCQLTFHWSSSLRLVVLCGFWFVPPPLPPALSASPIHGLGGVVGLPYTSRLAVLL